MADPGDREIQYIQLIGGQEELPFRDGLPQEQPVVGSHWRSSSALEAPLYETPQGAIRIGSTRVSLDTVIGAAEQGASAQEIVEQYPALQLHDVEAALDFYARFRADCDAYLRARRIEADRLQKINEARYGRSLKSRFDTRPHEP